MASCLWKDWLKWLFNKTAFMLFVFFVPTFLSLQVPENCPAGSLEEFAPSFEENIVHPEYLQKESAEQKTSLDSKLKLETLVDSALESHPALRHSWARVKAAAASVGQALSSYYPQVSSDVFYEYNDEGTYREYELWEENQKMGASLGITYLLLDNGGRKNSARAAKKELDAANSSYNQTVLDVVFAVQRRYYAYAESLQMLAAKQEDLRVARYNRDRARDFFKAGLSSKSAQIQARAHVSQVRYQLASITGEVRKNWSDLALECKIPVSPQREVEYPVRLDRDLVGKSAEELLRMVEDKNPGLQSLESRIQSGEHDVKAAESEFWPELSFVGSGTAQKVMSAERYQASSKEDEYQASVGFNITYDLFTGFSDCYKEREARANVKALREEYAQRQLALKQQVEDSLNGYRSAVDRLQAGDQYVKDAKNSYKLAVEFFTDGEGSMVEITRALEQLANARSEWVAARMATYTAAARLAHSCGAFEKMGTQRLEWQSMD
jgi:outer membrane protein TolC